MIIIYKGQKTIPCCGSMAINKGNITKLPQYKLTDIDKEVMRIVRKISDGVFDSPSKYNMIEREALRPITNTTLWGDGWENRTEYIVHYNVWMPKKVTKKQVEGRLILENMVINTINTVMGRYGIKVSYPNRGPITAFFNDEGYKLGFEIYLPTGSTNHAIITKTNSKGERSTFSLEKKLTKSYLKSLKQN